MIIDKRIEQPFFITSTVSDGKNWFSYDKRMIRRAYRLGIK